MQDPVGIKKVMIQSDEHMINRYLEAGWRILDTASGRMEDGDPLIIVLLGLPDNVVEAHVVDDRIHHVNPAR